MAETVLTIRESVRGLSPKEIASAQHSLSAFGFCEISSGTTDAQLLALQDEAIAAFVDAYHAERSDSARAALSYDAFIADLGNVGWDYLKSAGLREILAHVTGRTFDLQAEKSCLTYYLGGSYLAPHRDDIDGQNPVTVITYLWAESDDAAHADTGLQLQIYGNGRVPSARPQGRIATREGSIIVGYGNRFWHGRPRLRPLEKAISLTGSFRGPR